MVEGHTVQPRMNQTTDSPTAAAYDCVLNHRTVLHEPGEVVCDASGSALMSRVDSEGRVGTRGHAVLQ